MAEDYSTSERYFDASKERFTGAGSCYEARDFGTALYLAGLSIEAALMAFITPDVLGGIRAAHSFMLLANNGLARLLAEPEDSARLTIALTSAQLRWKNVYRYYPAEYLAGLVNTKEKRRGLVAPYDKSASNRVIGDAQTVGLLADRMWRKRDG